MPVITAIVDKERFKWLEQKVRGIFDARSAGALFTHDAA
jgi:hypothetical protein